MRPQWLAPPPFVTRTLFHRLFHVRPFRYWVKITDSFNVSFKVCEH